MKVTRLDISNFRGIRELDIAFGGPGGTVPNVTAILGDNGSGKTTVLQAIALVLTLASRPADAPKSFAWPGFIRERISTHGATRVRLDVSFTREELIALWRVRQAWQRIRNEGAIGRDPIDPPDELLHVTLIYEDGHLHTDNLYRYAVQMFWGRFFLDKLYLNSTDAPADTFRFGEVYWFDQERNVGSPARTLDAPTRQELDRWEDDVSRLREYLVGWWAIHTSLDHGNGRDYIPKLERYFEAVFPGTRILGIRPRHGRGAVRVSDFYFMLERDGNEFDIAEMSSGEQAIFPLLFEFVRMDIGNSVVLIDELELHLHPPQQQALVAALPKLGPDCQFIVTTHSPYLESVIPDEHEVRLEGGRLCV